MITIEAIAKIVPIENFETVSSIIPIGSISMNKIYTDIIRPVPIRA